MDAKIAKKEYNKACEEGRVVMVKDIPKKIDLDAFREFMGNNMPISQFTSYLMKNKPDCLQVYITYMERKNVLVAIRRLQNSEYVKKYRMFAAIASPIGGMHKQTAPQQSSINLPKPKKQSTLSDDVGCFEKSII